MALPMPPNVSVNIYRTSSPGTPYSLGSIAAAGVPGFLAPAVQNGRFGSAQWLKWTHILYLGPDTDIRDAYNTQLDPARDDSKGDTVILPDSQVPTTMTAFYVAFVERIADGTPGAHVRAYLDRFQPSTWPTDAL